MGMMHAMASRDLTLCLLGGWSLGVDPVLRVDGIGLAGRRLVALLALQGPTSRTSARDALWPTAGPVPGDHRLRNAVWRLGPERSGVFPDGLVEAAAGGLALRPQIAVDVRALTLAAAAVHRGEGDVDARIFEADLLPTWDDEWLVLERERVRQLRLHALETLSQTLLDHGRHAAALDCAITALHADPLRESAHRAVIRVHLAEGNTGTALQAFELCRHTLHTELGLPPTRAMMDLMAELTGPGPDR